MYIDERFRIGFDAVTIESYADSYKVIIFNDRDSMIITKVYDDIVKAVKVYNRVINSILASDELTRDEFISDIGYDPIITLD